MAGVDAPHVYVTYHQDPHSDEVARRLATDLIEQGALVALIDDSPSAPTTTRAMLTDPSEDRWLIALVAPPSVTSPWILNAVNSAQEAVIARRMRGVLLVTIASVPDQNIPVAWRSFPRLDATARSNEDARLDIAMHIGLLSDMPRTDPTNDDTGQVSMTLERAAELARLGELAQQDGQIEKAEGYYHQSLAGLREVGNRRGEGLVLSSLGEIAQQRGQLEEAEAYYQQSLTVLREVNDQQSARAVLPQLGDIAFQRGRMEEAEAYFRQSLAVEREVGDRQGEGAALSNLGQLAKRVGRLDEAFAYYQQSLTILSEVGNRRGAEIALSNLDQLAALGLPGASSATGSAGPTTGAGSGDEREETDAPSGSVLADERARSVASEDADRPAPPRGDAGPPDLEPAPAEEAPQPVSPGAPRSAGEADGEPLDAIPPPEPPPGYPDFKGYGASQPVPGQPPAPPAPPAPYSQPPTPPAYPAPAPSQQGAGSSSVPPQPVSLERVAFAAYYPKETQPAKPLPLLVYLALDEAPAMARVAALAAERLAGRLDQFRSGVADDRMTLLRGTKLRLVPVIPGFHVNPQWMDVTWDEDAQQHEFSVRADSAPAGRAAEGAVRVYQGLNLRAQIPVSIFVNAGTGVAPTPADFASAYARAYRQVFASYSHRDMPVVESCEAAARAMGDRYLRDLITLQSGQQWNNQLMRMIAEADIFQLFWSRNAAASPVVHQEWVYALTLQANRPGFIHPVYWSRAPFDIPHELGPLHFAPLDLSALGWSPVRRFFCGLQTG